MKEIIRYRPTKSKQTPECAAAAIWKSSGFGEAEIVHSLNTSCDNNIMLTPKPLNSV